MKTVRSGQTVIVKETDKEGPLWVRVDQVSQSGEWFAGYREDTPQANSTWYNVTQIQQQDG